MRESIPNFNYIEKIFTSVYSNIIVASEKGNKESVDELFDFLFFKLLTGSFGISLQSYKRSTSLIISLYQSELQIGYKEILVERAVESVTTKISLGSKYSSDYEDFISESYSMFLNLLKIILEEDNYEIFNRALKKNDDLLFKIDHRSNQNNYFFKFLTTLICWIYYLKFNSKLSYDKYRFDLLESEFSQVLFEIDNNFVNHFFKLYDEIEFGLWHVKSWEITKPPVNRVYFSLMPSQWMPFGLTILLLRNNHLTNFIDYGKIDTDRRFRFLFDDIKKILDTITIDSEAYIDFIFPNKINSKDLQQQLNYKKQNILEIFSVLKKIAEIDHYRKIQEIPLSKFRVDEFRQRVGELWQSNTIIINILKHFNKANYLENVESRDGFGFFQTLLKGKFAFIEGELHQEIYGLANYGSELARNLDNQFFDRLFEWSVEVKVDDLKSYLHTLILNKANIEKTIIFGNWRINDLLEIKYNNRSKQILESTYCGVPVVNSYSKYEEYVFVVDFEKVEVDIYTSESEKWYNNQLLVDVTESLRGEIGDDEIKKWNEKDGLKYTPVDVEILQGNNVDIKILFKGEYKFHPDFRVIIIKI